MQIKVHELLLLGGKVGIWSSFIYFIDRSGVLLKFFPTINCDVDFGTILHDLVRV